MEHSTTSTLAQAGHLLSKPIVITIPPKPQPLIQRKDPAIKTGLNQTNLITVVANGNSLVLYVNKQQIASVNDGTYSNGQIGVIAESTQNPTEVVFTNAEVWKTQ